jgi:hypothetical protein
MSIQIKIDFDADQLAFQLSAGILVLIGMKQTLPRKDPRPFYPRKTTFAGCMECKILGTQIIAFYRLKATLGPCRGG